jgi:cytochrome P450
MGDFNALIRSRTLARVSAWPVSGRIDLCSEMEQLSLGVITGAIFGEGYDDPEGRLARAITARRAFLEYMQASLLPWAEHWPLPAVIRYRRALQVIDREIARGPVGSGFAAKYRELRYPDGRAMSPGLWRDEVLTLMSTGYETTGDALIWTLYLLAQHPGIEDKVLAEIAAGGELEHTRRAADESLRLYPPTWIYVRMATGPDRLPSGLEVRAGDKLFLCQWVTQRDPRYFPDPGRFDPERFSDTASQSRPRLAYFPFGAGTRQCLGEHFAMHEILLVLSLILPRFRFVLEPGAERVVPYPGVTLRPKGGLWVRVEQRGSWCQGA